MPVNVRAARFPLFDSLRAIAALAVLATHAAVFAGVQYTASPMRPFAARLEVGVAIFFAISGFLLYRPFVLARVRGVAAPAAGPYAWRRFLRIVPAYWVALTVVALWTGLPGVFTAEGVLRFYGIAQAYDASTIGGGLAQAWSLTIEVAFYAFLPLYAFVVARLARGRGLRADLAGVAVLVLVAAGWKAAVLGGVHGGQVEVTALLLALPAYLDHFAGGMALAILSVWLQVRDSDELPRRLRWLDERPWIPWAVALAAFWAVSTRIGLEGEFFEPIAADQYWARHYLYAIVGVGIVTPAVVGDPARGWVRKLLGWRPLLWLGLISYGIFLWNLALMGRLEEWGLGEVAVLGGYGGFLVAGLAFTVLFAAASYYVVERPALSLRRLFGGQPPATRGEAVEERAPVAAAAPTGPAG